MPNDFSPDGRFLIYEDQHPTQKKDLWVLPVADGKPIPFVTTTADETTADFSPDGKWVAYSSDETGTREVPFRDLRRSERLLRRSANGGVCCRW